MYPEGLLFLNIFYLALLDSLSIDEGEFNIWGYAHKNSYFLPVNFGPNFTCYSLSLRKEPKNLI